MSAGGPSTRVLIVTWLLLLLLLGATVASSHLSLGAGNVVANLLIATIMSWLVMVYFMQLHMGSTTVRLVAISGLLWLLLLVMLTVADTFTRQPSLAPW